MLVSMHPSAVLRADAGREERRAELVADLRLARDTVRRRGRAMAQRSKSAKS